MSVGRCRIVVIEDDPETAEQIAEFLTTKGYHVHLAVDGDDGLSRAWAADYAVATIDRMPVQVQTPWGSAAAGSCSNAW